MKATFQLTLVLDKNVTAINNMPLARNATVGPSTGMRTWQFATTPKMSTYLVAWAIGMRLHGESKHLAPESCWMVV